MKARLRNGMLALALLGAAGLAAPAFAADLDDIEFGGPDIYVGPAYAPDIYPPEVYAMPYAAVPPPDVAEIYVAPPYAPPPEAYLPPPEAYLPPPAEDYGPGEAIVVGD